MKLAVAGGTGVVGRHLVDRARAAGHEVAVLSRATGTDLVTGEGLHRALTGAEAVVDVTSIGSLSRSRSSEFFETVTRRLHAAELDLGIGHHLVLSIVGIDRMDAGYYAGKLAQERAVADSTVPWTVLRATQFHEFAEQTIVRSGPGPVVVVPRAATRTVAAADVASRLLDLAYGRPSGRVADLGGPEDNQLVDLVREVLRHRRSRRRAVEVPLPGPMGRGMRDGALRPGPDADEASTRFADWLQSRPTGAR